MDQASEISGAENKGGKNEDDGEPVKDLGNL